MAFNFSAQQFESAFEPKKLRNWEVTRKCALVTGKHPKFRGQTKMTNESKIKNLTQISSKSTQLEKQVDTDDKPADKILSSWEKRSSHIPITNNWVEIDSVCSPIQRKDTDSRVCGDSGSDKSPTPAAQTRRSCQNHNDRDLTTHPVEPLKSTTPNEEEPVLRNAYSNDVKAKNVRRNDHEHHRLADAIDWPTHNNARSSSQPSNAEIDATAVGYKIYLSPSATQCSKLKVFRPKTAGAISDHVKENKYTKIDRPKSSVNRLHRRSIKPLGEMDLAIYWDVPPSEQKATFQPTATASSGRRPSAEATKNDVEKKSADHENRSSSIVAVSRSPSREAIDRLCPQVNRSSDSDRRLVVKKSADLVPELPKLEQLVDEANAITVRSAAESSKRPMASSAKLQLRSAGSLVEVAELPKRINVGVQVSNLDLRRLTGNSKQCAVDSSRNVLTGKCTASTNAYKMAFKAGKLNNFNINNTSFIERLAKSRNLCVPKPKTPFAKKSYSIRTLMPPFSIWPQSTGQDYPDHWRLASVYQHAYKPLELRKSPFMKTVFQ